MRDMIAPLIANNSSYRSAFTLMELMVVVSAVGLMAAFAIPSYTKAVERGHERSAINDLTLIHSKQSDYEARYGNYYPSITGNGDNVGVAALNAAFQLSLTETSFRYYCSESGGSGNPGTFACYAVRFGGPTVYTIKVKDSDAIDPPNYPCCSSGTCYISLPTPGC